MKRRSDRKKLEDSIKDLIRKILKIERGRSCEICGRNESVLPYPLSLFHILPEGSHPKMKFHKRNLLLSCWTPHGNRAFCHDAWHKCCESEPQYQAVEKKVKKLRGDNYWMELLAMEKMQDKHSLGHLKFMKEALKIELKALEQQGK